MLKQSKLDGELEEVRLIPEDAAALNRGVLIVEENCFKIYLSRYNIMGSGLSIEEAAQSALSQIPDV